MVFPISPCAEWRAPRGRFPHGDAQTAPAEEAYAESSGSTAFFTRYPPGVVGYHVRGYVVPAMPRSYPQTDPQKDVVRWFMPQTPSPVVALPRRFSRNAIRCMMSGLDGAIGAVPAE